MSITKLKLIKGNTKSIVRKESFRVRAVYCASRRPGCRARFFSLACASSCNPDDTYAYGANRGGIDERWFASTTEAANEGRVPDEGLSYCVVGRERLTLRKAVEDCGAVLVGKQIWNKYRRWPVYSKFFDNMGPIPHHMHQNEKQAKLVGQEGKPESYYFPPQHNNVGNNFPYTFFGLEPGTTKAQVRQCLEELE